MDEGMLVNDGAYYLPQEPPEREQQRQSARGKARANRDVIQEVIDRLEARIAYYATIDAYPEHTMLALEDFRTTVAANKQTVANLRLELAHWKGVLKDAA